MLHKLARFAALACMLCAGQALALGLGDINVKSKLNQPFSATIPIVASSPGELDNLTVQLAGAADFANAGIERADYLSTLTFTVEKGVNGAYVVVNSEKHVRDPFLNFIVEARGNSGRVLHEYTVLLDPPEVSSAEAPAATPAPAAALTAAPPPPIASAAAAEPAPATPATPRPGRHARPAPHSAPAVAATAPADAAAPMADAGDGGSASQYGPVAPQETLWSIAVKLRPNPKVSMDQVLLALYRANPAAFDHGHFNGLLKGVKLSVPSASYMLATSPVQAKTEVDHLRAGGRLAAAAPAAPTSAELSAELSESPAPRPAKPAVPSSMPAPAARAPTPPISVPPIAAEPPPAPVAAAPSPTISTPAASSPPAAAATPAPGAAEAAKPDASASITSAQPPAASTPGPQAATPPAPRPPPPPPQSSLLDGLLMPLLAAVLILGLGYFAWRYMNRRNQDRPPDFGPPGGFKPAGTKTPPLGSKAPPGPPTRKPPPKPGDTAKLSVTPPAAPAKPASPPPAAAPAAEPLDATANFNQTAKLKPATPAGSDVDFDLTSQFEAQTLQINLDANDPLSEAEFHLAYGLYDEAASLLKQALAKEPNRQDLRVKLAETYFAAGKPVEFQETAEGLHGQVNAGEWQKIAIMGRQLCPDSALFKGEGGGGDMHAVDMALGDSIAAAPAPAARPPAPAKPAAHDVIDFDLDAELLKSEAGKPAPAPAPAPAAAKPAAPAAPAEFDLSHFDLSGEHHPPLGEGTVEFNLDELDLSKPDAAPGDEIGTKLDLARAYADMGDNEAARGLLNEVLTTGNPTQKQEAEALSKRLSA